MFSVGDMLSYASSCSLTLPFCSFLERIDLSLKVGYILAVKEV